MPSPPLAIFLHSDAYDRVYQAVNLVATAAGSGRRCYLFLFYHALGAYLDGAWDDAAVSPPAGPAARDGAPARWAAALERGFELANLPSLYEVLDEARRAEGEVTVFACSNSIHLLAVDPADARARVDGIVGLATMLDIAADGCQILYL